ncbi:MAG TPA: YhjD/YihY/BrkB family envelope integrity protein, partial [Acidobacteriota bacterium]|nr:YhjD/YihY/BrkB family envelope integrity protein [Acidobacteriota bacterium]
MRVDLGAFRFLIMGKFWTRLWNEINDDNCWGMAAQLSYYFLMAFFPFLIFLSAVIGFIPVGPDVLKQFLAEFNIFMPDKTYDLVNGIVTPLLQSRAEGLLTFGILLSLWFGSLAFNGMISVLNQAYQAKETRSYLHTRSLSIFVTVVVSLFTILSMVLLFFGDWLIRV